jgi:hypothetical protein
MMYIRTCTCIHLYSDVNFLVDLGRSSRAHEDRNKCHSGSYHSWCTIASIPHFNVDSSHSMQALLETS